MSRIGREKVVIKMDWSRVRIMQQQLKDKDPPENAQHYYTEKTSGRESKVESRVIGHSFFPEESGEEDDT